MVQKFYNILVTKKSENDFVATLPGSNTEGLGSREEQALKNLFFNLAHLEKLFDNE